MTDSLTLYDLAPSPNNIKIRLALGLKGIPYERVPVDPGDRTKIVEVSGQPLTPVLVHGDRVLFDSSAILRYIDANFRRTGGRLYSADTDRFREIEDWERFAAHRLAPPVKKTFGQFFAQEKDQAVLDEANEILARATERTEEALDGSDFLMGGEPTAADCQAAPWAYYGMVGAEAAAANPLAAFFRERLRLPDGRDRTRAWVDRMMAFDVVPGA